MNEVAVDHWKRALAAIKSAEALIKISPDDSASRAYYAAFHAVSAFFALDNREFIKHSAINAAVHRDLVKEGICQQSFGKDYSFLLTLREAGDYGGKEHVDEASAQKALEAAERIIKTVSKNKPSLKEIIQ